VRKDMLQHVQFRLMEIVPHGQRVKLNAGVPGQCLYGGSDAVDGRREQNSRPGAQRDPAREPDFAEHALARECAYEATDARRELNRQRRTGKRSERVQREVAPRGPARHNAGLQRLEKKAQGRSSQHRTEQGEHRARPPPQPQRSNGPHRNIGQQVHDGVRPLPLRPAQHTLAQPLHQPVRVKAEWGKRSQRDQSDDDDNQHSLQVPAIRPTA